MDRDCQCLATQSKQYVGQDMLADTTRNQSYTLFGLSEAAYTTIVWYKPLNLLVLTQSLCQVCILRPMPFLTTTTVYGQRLVRWLQVPYHKLLSNQQGMVM